MQSFITICQVVWVWEWLSRQHLSNFVNNGKKKFFHLIEHYYLRGKPAKEAKKNLISIMTHLLHWIQHSKCRCKSLSLVVRVQNTNHVQGGLQTRLRRKWSKQCLSLVTNDRKLKVREISKMVNISTEGKGFSNRDITILSMNKIQKYLRYWVQIYYGCSASITIYEWNSVSVIWPPRARLQRSILWTQFSTTLAHTLRKLECQTLSVKM